MDRPVPVPHRPAPDRLIPLRHAAVMLGVSRLTLAGSCETGRVRAVKLGSGRGQWFIPASAIEELLEGKPREAATG